MRTPRTLTWAVVISLSLLFFADTSVLANGGKARRVRYFAEVRTGDGQGKVCRFEAELEPLLFRLITFRDRYRVIRVTIRNTGDTRVMLSRTGDRVELEFSSGRPLRGILDVAAHDPPAWDSLPVDLRAAIAYPQGIEAGEEESVVVFIQTADVVAAPRALRYTIASLPGAVTMRDMTPVPKK